MSTVGQIEKKTQARVVELFRERLGYDYLGDKTDLDNRNIEETLLRGWLSKQGVSDLLISRALHELTKAAGDTSKSLYDRNKDVYDLLRYGIKVQPGAGENRVTVWLIDWKHPENNHFAIAEEVTVKGADLGNAAKAKTKRPDVVIYINGIALGVLELKRSTVSVAEGIRQNLDNQKKEFIEPFFSTMQWVMAGNDSEGLRYATIETPEKYYLRWVEDSGACASEPNLLDRHLLQVCSKPRLLELIHDFVVFDAGTKKLCRQNQYFGVKAAQDFIRRREGGILWHTQGSGKSLTMVWLAKWIRENREGARVLIITDRTELDEQIEKVFLGVHEQTHLLEVQHLVRHVLKDAVDGGELMLHAGNLHRHKGSTLQGGKQHTTHGIADGGAVTSLQRFANKLAVRAAGRVFVAQDLVGLDELVPVARIDKAFALFDKHEAPAYFE